MWYAELVISSLHILELVLPAFSNTTPLFLTQPPYHLASADSAMLWTGFVLRCLNTVDLQSKHLVIEILCSIHMLCEKQGNS